MVTWRGAVAMFELGRGLLLSTTAWAEAAVAMTTRSTAAIAGTARTRRRRRGRSLITLGFDPLASPGWTGAAASGRGTGVIRPPPAAGGPGGSRRRYGPGATPRRTRR